MAVEGEEVDIMSFSTRSTFHEVLGSLNENAKVANVLQPRLALRFYRALTKETSSLILLHS